jgi:hypothetical protein
LSGLACISLYHFSIVQVKHDEKVNKTGTGKFRVTLKDRFVLDFIGRKLPLVTGLGVPQSGSNADEEEQHYLKSNYSTVDNDDGKYLIFLFFVTYQFRS